MKLKYHLIAVAVSLAVSLTGCANSGYNTSVNSNLKKDEPSFFSQSGGISCLVGAALAGATCAGLKSDKKAQCLAYAAAGCAAAMTANYMLDSLRANYHNLEDQLDATRAKVDESVRSTRSLRETSKETLAQDKAEIEQLKADIKSGRKSSAVLSAKLNQMENNLAYMKERLEKDKENYKAQIDTRNALVQGQGKAAARDTREAQSRLEALDAEILRLQDEINGLTGDIETYATQTSILRRDVRG